MLLKLTSPEVPGEPAKNRTCYVDPRHIIMITREMFEPVKRKVLEERNETIEDLWRGTRQLATIVSGYMPSMDDPTAVGWMVQAKEAANHVGAIYTELNRVHKGETPRHPAQEVTVVHLGCGTALEHGVMLAKVWVVETPEEIASVLDVREGRLSRTPPDRFKPPVQFRDGT